MSKYIFLVGCVVVIALLALVPRTQAAEAEDLTAPSGLTAAEYEAAMPEALKGYGGAIYDAEAKHGINGLFLLAVIRLESGNGCSSLAQNSHNVAGNKGPLGYMTFETLSAGIDYAAENLAENYLAEGGKWYRGGTLEDIEAVYCPGGGWAAQVRGIMREYRT